MSKTTMRAGPAIAIFVQDGQGRRVLVAAPEDSAGLVRNPVRVGATKAEVRQCVGALLQLSEELPD